MQSLPTPRLRAVADMAPTGAAVADIGTDHAYIPIYLVANGICPRAVASDVRSGPASRAEINVAKSCLEGKIRVCVADGLCGIAPGEVQTVIIAGMGGRLIARIMEEGLDRLRDVSTLVLQPMTEPEEVRRWLCARGWRIADEELVLERDKFYFVIKAVKGMCSCDKSEVYYRIGNILIRKRPEMMRRYLSREVARMKRAIAGMELSRKTNWDFELYQSLLKQYQTILEAVSNGENK